MSSQESSQSSFSTVARRRPPQPAAQEVEPLQRPTRPAAAAQTARLAPSLLTAGNVSQLQRTIGNQGVTGFLARAAQRRSDGSGRAESDTAPKPVIQRLPYAKAYSASNTRSLLNDSEGRASPVNNAVGHPRQHVGKWEKAERYAEEQGKTKSVYTNTAEQDKAIQSALAAGQAELAKLDANPAEKKRVAIANVATEAAEVLVVKAKKKKDTGNVKSWAYQSGAATKATVIVDSMGTGTEGDVHIQTAFPVFD